MEHYTSTLYQKGARGETRQWKIWVTEEDGCGIIHRQHGVLDGKQIYTSRKVDKGKNIGKSNETTPIEQAISMARSIAVKKSAEGYSPDISGDSLPMILPMLAHDYTKQKKPLSLPCYAQPKLDGVRMLVERTADGVRMTTRTGKPVCFMEHIQSAFLASSIPVGVVLDGELYTPDKTFEEITSIVRKTVKKHHKPEDARTVSYYVFDMYNRDAPDMTYTERRDYLGTCDFTEEIQLVPSTLVSTMEEAHEWHEKYVSEGYEGTMYRNPSSVYRCKVRSRDLLKRKDFVTDEYRIVGANQGVGKDEGTVIWQVSADGSDTVFNVRPRGSMARRREWWEKREEYMGKYLTVRYQNLTEAGTPRFPVGLTIRDYE